METFYKRLYKYRERLNKNAKENFLTEILAQCLIVDFSFRDRFLAEFGITEVTEFKCKTQYIDKVYGQPDLYLLVNKTTEIIIECKVGAKQSPNQLENYATLLSNSVSENKHLVYLTKYYEPTEDFSNVVFNHIRWYHIFNLLKGSTNQLSIELSKYLIEEKMSTVIPFNKSEISAIKSFNETFGKMNDMLGRIKDVIKSKTNNKVRQNINISQGEIGLSCDLKSGFLWIGFYQYEEHEEIQFCVSVEAKKIDKDFKKLHQYLNSNNFNYYDHEGTRYWLNTKNLTDFFEDEIFKVENAVQFVEKRLDEIEQLL